MCVCVVGHTHVYLERLKIDLGVFPCPSSFAEARALAKAFPSASRASQLALGICRLQVGHHTYLSGFLCLHNKGSILSHLSSPTFMNQLVNLYPLFDSLT